MVFTEPVELKWYTVLRYGLASGTHSDTSAFEPRGDSGYMPAEYLLVSVFMTLNSIPEACLVLVSCQYTTGYGTLHCKCRKSHVRCTVQCGCSEVVNAYCSINRC